MKHYNSDIKKNYKNKHLLVLYLNLILHVYVVPYYMDKQDVYERLSNILNIQVSLLDKYYKINYVNNKWFKSNNFGSVNWIKMVRIFKIWNPIIAKKSYNDEQIERISFVPGNCSNIMNVKLILNDKMIVIECKTDILVKEFIKEIKRIKNLKYNFKLMAMNQQQYEIYKNNRNEKNLCKILQFLSNYKNSKINKNILDKFDKNV